MQIFHTMILFHLWSGKYTRVVLIQYDKYYNRGIKRFNIGINSFEKFSLSSGRKDASNIA